MASAFKGQLASDHLKKLAKKPIEKIFAYFQKLLEEPEFENGDPPFEEKIISAFKSVDNHFNAGIFIENPYLVESEIAEAAVSPLPTIIIYGKSN